MQGMSLIGAVSTQMTIRNNRNDIRIPRHRFSARHIGKSKAPSLRRPTINPLSPLPRYLGRDHFPRSQNQIPACGWIPPPAFAFFPDLEFTESGDQE